MKRALTFAKETEEDLVGALQYYSSAGGPELARRFLFAVRAAVAEAERRPDAFALTEKDLRRVPVQGFLYGVFYKLSRTRIHVAGIWHASRDFRQLHKRR